MKKTEKTTHLVRNILICAGIGLVAAGIVLAILIFANRITGYDEVKSYTDEILSQKDAVMQYLDAEINSEEYNGVLSDEQKGVFDGFFVAIEKSDELMKKISGSDAMRDKEVKENYDEVVARYEKIHNVYDIEHEFKDIFTDGKLSDEEIEKFSSSENEYLKQIAVDLKEYKKTVDAFYEKYPEGKGISSSEKKVLDEDYGVLKDASDKLEKKYAAISLEDVASVKKDDFVSFFESVEVLNKILSEKM